MTNNCEYFTTTKINDLNLDVVDLDNGMMMMKIIKKNAALEDQMQKTKELEERRHRADEERKKLEMERVAAELEQKRAMERAAMEKEEKERMVRKEEIILNYYI